MTAPDPAISISSALAAVPQPLHSQVLQFWEDFSAAGGLPGRWCDENTLSELTKVWATSAFVAQSCARDPQLLLGLLESGDLHHTYPAGRYREHLAALLEDAHNEADLHRILRRFRRREMVRIAWRDLASHADLIATTTDLSALADACVDLALEHLHRWHCEQWGHPYDAQGREQRLVVIGMGKLGARELNFSSDIDLIFAYAEDGETRDGRRAVSCQEFFIRLGQRLIQALNNTTADGLVFRVDMRLRPFGEASALAVSFDAMEDYYLVHGREWERYAMIKARVIAGDMEAGVQLMQALRPFVFRRYIDFGAFESLREMKAMIEHEVQRKGMAGNVKLGAGGIREVEFIGQAFQLIRGGREPTLQTRRILTVLEALRGFQLLPGYVVEELRRAYVFLRNTEHRIQEYADRQAHALPEGEEERLRLAFSMGFAQWESFDATLRAHMRRVHQHFEQVFAAPQNDHADGDALDLRGVWLAAMDEGRATAALAHLGFSEPADVVRRLQRLREGHAYRALSAQGRSRLDRLMPLLLGAAAGAAGPDLTLQRVLVLVETVARRTAYLALLVENPMALSQLVQLCSASAWIAALLARHPLLLDELLDPRTLYAPPQRSVLEGELRQRLSHLEQGDTEAQMDALRNFKQAHVLRVAAADVAEAVPLMVVSDQLTDLAEVLLEQVLDLAWRHLIGRHGRPHCGGERLCDTGFAIIGYGKLGGIELGYGSDLDIVFLHADDATGQATDGERPVDNAVFYARLAQRIIHLLNTRTGAGELYEVDLRLRPSGASGLMVSSIRAFAEYQERQAWTWEHQALVRARVVVGDPQIAESFQQVRARILAQPRDGETLRGEVREMRQRMREHLSRSGPDMLDLKQDPGAIADIEFMVQYGVLAWSHAHPDLLRVTDNIRLLEGFAERGLMERADAQLLCDAYRAYRIRVHRLALQELPAVAAEEEFRDYRDAVLRIWDGLIGEGAGG